MSYSNSATLWQGLLYTNQNGTITQFIHDLANDISYSVQYLWQSAIDSVERERRIIAYAMKLRWLAQKYIKNDMPVLKPRKERISVQIWNRYTRLEFR